FTAVGEGANAQQIGTRIGANARAVAMLLNALVALGLLSKSGDDYKNTAESARFLVQGSKDNHRNGLLHNAKARAPLVVKALGTAGVRRILDLGGGSGAYSIAFAKACPYVQCEILDIPEVVPLTSEYVSQAGVSTQISLRAGDMLQDDFGSGYDIIMLNAICHMFSEEQNRHIFRRARQALAPKGRLVVQDFVLNSDKTGPQQAALFSLNMLVSTDAGASYSEPEYTQWMKAAGFTEVCRINLP